MYYNVHLNLISIDGKFIIYILLVLVYVIVILLIFVCSTVRLWDVNTEGKKHKTCIKPKSQQGRKLVPTACAYSNDGRWVAAACQDGSIQIWDHNKNFVRWRLRDTVDLFIYWRLSLIGPWGNARLILYTVAVLVYILLRYITCTKHKIMC